MFLQRQVGTDQWCRFAGQGTDTRFAPAFRLGLSTRHRQGSRSGYSTILQLPPLDSDLSAVEPIRSALKKSRSAGLWELNVSRY